MSSALPALRKIEERFDSASVKRWMDHNWRWSLYVSVLYLVLIYIGSRIMRNKPAFHLRRALTIWNAGLATFSILGAVPFVMDRMVVTMNQGFLRTVCATDMFSAPSSHLWAWLFSFSKIVELGDTAFIVLRKTPLSSLHWYHHITVLGLSWFAFTVDTAVSIWFGAMNFCVHSVMYTYYAVKASGRRVPECIAQVITILQICQMFAGMASNVLAYLQFSSGLECRYEPTLVFSGLVIYSSYSVFFMHFFYTRYCVKRARRT